MKKPLFNQSLGKLPSITKTIISSPSNRTRDYYRDDFGPFFLSSDKKSSLPEKGNASLLVNQSKTI